MPAAPAPADPFATFEQKLAAKGYRPAGWYDVLDTCHFRDRKTGQEVKLDRDRLQRIADHRNQMVVGRESVSHYCLGHTEDKAPEWEQPPVVALMSRWRVGQYPDGSPNLEAYSWEKPGHEGVLDKYPQRSAELWLDPDDVNPVALLGATTPRRNLSLRLSRDFDENGTPTSSGRSVVRFWRHNDPNRQPILFEMRADMGSVNCAAPPADAGAPPGAEPDEFESKLGNSSSIKEMSAKLDKMMGLFEQFAPVMQQIIEEESAMAGPGLDAGGPGGPPGAGPGLPPPGAPPMPPAGGPPAPPAGGPPIPPPPGGGPDAPPLPDRPDGPPDKKNMAGSAPGFGNTAMPNYLDRPHDQTAIRMQRLESDNVGLKRQLAEKDGQVKALADQVKALQFARVHDEVSATLAQLEREGYAVKPDVDLPHLCGLEPETRKAAVQFMRETRAKKDVTPVPGGGTDVVDPTKVLQPIRFGMSDGLSLPGDPAIVTQPAPAFSGADYARMAAEARAKGISPLQAYEAARAPQANGTATAVR